MAQAAGVKFTSKTLVGEVANVLADYAQKNDCGGIVMGTRGMGAIGNLLLGSVATKVIHLTKLPVTLVK
jgi:nucleotide-binding universal stress UspA family protein